MRFYDWLRKQTKRDDVVGKFARHAMKDKVCPRKDMLHLYLLRYENHPEQRRAVKAAHKEWRALRREAKLAARAAAAADGDGHHDGQQPSPLTNDGTEPQTGRPRDDAE